MKYVKSLGSIGNYVKPVASTVKNKLLLPKTEYRVGAVSIASTFPLAITYAAALDQPGVDIADPAMYAIRTLIPALLGTGLGLVIHSYSRSPIDEMEV